MKIILGRMVDGKKRDEEHIIAIAHVGYFWEALLVLSEEMENFASSDKTPTSAVEDIRDGLENQGLGWQDKRSGEADIGVYICKNGKEQLIQFSGDGCKNWYDVPLRKEIKISLGGIGYKYLPLLVEESLYSMTRRAETFTHFQVVSKKRKYEK